MWSPLDDIQVKMGLITEQPQSTPPCPGCASTTRLQQMANKTETFFGCSRFPLCKRVVYTSLTTVSRVSPSAHSGSAAQPIAEQVMVLDSDSVGSEENFTMLNVPAEPAVTPQEKQFLLEQLLHLSSSSFECFQRNCRRSMRAMQFGLCKTQCSRSEQHGSAAERPSVDRQNRWQHRHLGGRNSALQHSWYVILFFDGN